MLFTCLLFAHLILPIVALSEEKKSIANECEKNLPCVDIPANCLICEFNTSCVYGSQINVSCKASHSPSCTGPKEFVKSMSCSYCYQLPQSNYVCSRNESCKLGTKYRALCEVKEDVICIGRRSFYKRVDCNYSSGFNWTTTLILSIVLGGFGVDRFYLGNWQEGIGKLFSFGGLGVWTLIDAILIAAGYLKPGDSRYSWARHSFFFRE